MQSSWRVPRQGLQPCHLQAQVLRKQQGLPQAPMGYPRVHRTQQAETEMPQHLESGKMACAVSVLLTHLCCMWTD